MAQVRGVSGRVRWDVVETRPADGRLAHDELAAAHPLPLSVLRLHRQGGRAELHEGQEAHEYSRISHRLQSLPSRLEHVDFCRGIPLCLFIVMKPVESDAKKSVM